MRHHNYHNYHYGRLRLPTDYHNYDSGVRDDNVDDYDYGLQMPETAMLWSPGG